MLLLGVLDEGILLGVVVDVETKAGRVDVAVAPDKQSTEDRLGQEVKDTVEEGLAVGVDDVTTLRQAPGNWVESPEEGGQRSADEECAADISAHGIGVAAGLPDQDVEDVEESDTAENEVSPLVRGRDQSTDKTSDDHDLVNKNDVEDSRGRERGGEQQVEQKERGGNDPVDVANVEYLTGWAGERGARELDVDGDAAEI